ncbi:hypothetical protein DL93DRAFT_2082773 [Clavulina sp. PMI_390]|nr:hypothetical protein DL93DRAFT_2082773 [Clavulina sp. PMI_390]
MQTLPASKAPELRSLWLKGADINPKGSYPYTSHLEITAPPCSRRDVLPPVLIEHFFPSHLRSATVSTSSRPAITHLTVDPCDIKYVNQKCARLLLSSITSFTLVLRRQEADANAAREYLALFDMPSLEILVINHQSNMDPGEKVDASYLEAMVRESSPSHPQAYVPTNCVHPRPPSP